MTHYTVKCPHCKGILRTTKTDNGSPFRKCPHCGQPYIDNECYEQALKPYKKESKVKTVLKGVIAAAFFAAIPFGIAAAIIVFGDFNISDSIAFVVYLIAFFILSPIFIHMFLKSYDEDEEARYKAWVASDQRMRDIAYARAVKKLGFKVPEYYLIDTASTN